MNINKPNRIAFGALMIEKGNAQFEQMELMKRVIMNPELDSKIIYDLEDEKSDVYISAGKDEKTVDIKLRKSAGFVYNYVPNDDNGSIMSKFNLSDTTDDISKKLASFVARARGFIYEAKDKPINKRLEAKFENLYAEGKQYSSTEKTAQILKPYNLQNACCYFGEPQVLTANSDKVFENKFLYYSSTWVKED